MKLLLLGVAIICFVLAFDMGLSSSLAIGDLQEIHLIAAAKVPQLIPKTIPTW